MTSLTITARLSTPVIGLDRWDSMLDGPLSWAWVQREKASSRQVPPITDRLAPDFPLPLERWQEGDVWGWKVSSAALDVAAWTGVQIRRKPAVDAMARYTQDRKHHAGLGPYKARDATLGAVLARTATWQAEVTDESDLTDLLGHITNLAQRHRNDFGHVTHWTVEPGPRDGWKARPMPHPDGEIMGIRAPYWHHTRKQPCRRPT